MRPIDGILLFVGFFLGWIGSKPQDFWVGWGLALYLFGMILAIITAEQILLWRTNGEVSLKDPSKPKKK